MNEDIYFEKLEAQTEIIEAELDADDGYREWSETIEKQNQEMQILDDYYNHPDSLVTLEDLNQETAEYYAANLMQVIDLSHLSWEQVIDKLLGHPVNVDTKKLGRK